MKINWATLAAWAGVIVMVLLFGMDKFGGKAAAMGDRITVVERDVAVISNTVTLELKNISFQLMEIRRKIK
jgi:hypothetical protein